MKILRLTTKTTLTHACDDTVMIYQSDAVRTTSTLLYYVIAIAIVAHHIGLLSLTLYIFLVLIAPSIEPPNPAILI